LNAKIQWRFALAGVFYLPIMNTGFTEFFYERRFRRIFFCAATIVSCLFLENIQAQSIRFPWNGYGHDAQHDAIASVASQPVNRILWQTPVDLNPHYYYYGSNSVLYIHYGSPSITRSNTVIVPVKTGETGGFEVEALAGATGATNWVRTTDYILPPVPAPPTGWTPTFSPTLTPKNRLCFPGGGGTVYYCDTPDTTNNSPVIGQIAFYGLTNYTANTNAYLNNVYINTPITSDRYGNIFFGFQVTGPTPLNLQSGIARIDFNGTGIWISATNAASDSAISGVAINCAPALSNDHKTLYVAVSSGYAGYGYLVALDSRTLAPLASVRLKDARTPGNDAYMLGESSASPTVGPDGDVYYGVLENPLGANHQRGWLLHFNGALTQSKIPGAFGWDDSASVVSASLVSSYHGSSPYLLMTKYNNYTGAGGDGVNKIAVLDPQNSETDPVSGATVMNEVITIAGPTPDSAKTNAYPNAVREWCINSAVVDPSTKSILVNNEDGKLYRWDLTSNTLSETNVLTTGIGEAYTPTIIGVNGFVYAINNAILFAIGH
jgi:hypothetical protein